MMSLHGTPGSSSTSSPPGTPSPCPDIGASRENICREREVRIWTNQSIHSHFRNSGIEKPPFDLPEFIKKTGIMEMREALQEKEEQKGMKSKMREKVRPKLGKIDIDYQKLHDAFFKWQTKPRMTLHGDLYYEGKEFEIRLKEQKPGESKKCY